MGSSRQLVKTNARRKGWSAVGVCALTVATTASALALSLPAIAALAAIGGGAATAQKTYEWLKYRGTWGLRF